MMAPFSKIFVLVWFCLGISGAQVPAPDLKDPVALLKAARATNGLSGDDLKPWHLKASYELFNDDGKPMGTGVFEEWWIANDKWKRSFVGDHYSGTQYESADGIASEGDRVPWPESEIADALISPVSEKLLPAMKLSLPHLNQDVHPPMLCVEVSGKDSQFSPEFGPDAYCFDEGTTKLRVRKSFYVVALYAKAGVFQGRRVGMETTIELNRHRLVEVHLDTLASDDKLDAQGIAPKPGATFSRPATLGIAGVTPPKLIHSVDPIYPQELSKKKVEGLVVVSLVIGKMGELYDFRLLESPNDAMGESALKAVRAYRFHPAKQNGQPIAVTIAIQVNFYVR